MLAKLVFNYMIELTTGAVFLLASVYGSGQTAPATNPASLDATTTQIEATSTTVTESSFTDPKAIEAYVRKEYANEPILIDVARCESTYRQFDQNGQIIRGRVNHQDVGVMQINEKYHADEAVKMGLNIYTVEGNVAFGKYLYDKYGTQPWNSSAPCWGSIAQN